jgi:hypothetical protein
MTRYAPSAPRNLWTIPKGKIAIHNHAAHHVGQKSGENGFRVWFPQDRLRTRGLNGFCKGEIR